MKKLHRLVAACVLALVAGPPPVQAHPHTFIDASPDLVFGPDGRLAAVRVTWAFDELYSTFAVEGLDKNGNGRPDAHELQPLAERIIARLPEFEYFMTFHADQQAVAFGTIHDYDIAFRAGQLRIDFTLPLREPLDATAHILRFATFDPTFYIAIQLSDDIEPLRLTGTPPAGCRLALRHGKDLAEAGGLPESFFDDTNRGFAAEFAQWVTIDCRPAAQ